MGNRAVVTVKGSNVGVYLHWNGGRESVQAFLRAAKDLNVRDPIDDTSYFYSRFVQIIGNYFGGTTSIGIDTLSNLDCDNGNNGVFVVGKGFKIITGKKGSVKAEEDAIYKETMEVNHPIFERGA